MSDLDDIKRTIAGIQGKLAAERNENRAKMPTIAAWKDTLEKNFGSVKVIFAEENGIKLGKPQPEFGPNVDYLNHAPRDWRKYHAEELPQNPAGGRKVRRPRTRR